MDGLDHVEDGAGAVAAGPDKAFVRLKHDVDVIAELARDAASKMTWSHTRSRSWSRCDDSTTVSSPPATPRQRGQERSPGQRVERRYGLVQEQDLGAFGQCQA